MRLLSLLLLLPFATKAQPCSTAARPIVFVHGFLASGDTWAATIQRFSTNGYCDNRLFVFDWNTLGGKLKNDSLLDVFVDGVLRQTKAQQVDLVGHSAGGGLCYAYLKDSARAAKVAHYAHLGSSKMKAPAGPSGNVPTLNMYNDSDKVVRSGGDIPGAENQRLSGKDHLQAATSAISFAYLYVFFTNSHTVKTSIEKQPGKLLKIGGRAVSLGSNEPLAGDSFQVFLMDPATGQYQLDKKSGRAIPYLSWTKFGSNGEWAFTVPKDSYLAFEVRPANGQRLFYYVEPPLRNNPALYIRALPTEGMAANMLKGIPNDAGQTALVIFTANQAVISGRDSLALDSIPLSLPSLTPAGKTAIASFVFDDGDGKTSGKGIKRFTALPFLSGVDVLIPADAGKTMRIYFNGRSMLVPKRSSQEGITVVVFN